ncbi:MAG: DUF4372 domain-containing protein [Balneolales bacterium]
MIKNKPFSGQPIIKQLLNSKLIYEQLANSTLTRYYKGFKTYDHVVTMLFTALSGVNSLRELSSVMLKINHLNMKYFPRCSTISDANR